VLSWLTEQKHDEGSNEALFSLVDQIPRSSFRMHGAGKSLSSLASSLFPHDSTEEMQRY
jgi:hypothetical protein